MSLSQIIVDIDRCTTLTKEVSWPKVVSLIGQEFARKLIPPFGGSQNDVNSVIANEVRVIDKLCKGDGHSNTIKVLTHDWLNGKDQYYFFDMELCEMNLEGYMHEHASKLGLKYLDPIVDDELSSLSLWGIIRQITSGLDFIHNHRELHRDLKPRNGIFVLSTSILIFCSALLCTRQSLEDNRFRSHRRGDYPI